jgi:tetratricopeptide (TPR) repeat protein
MSDRCPRNLHSRACMMVTPILLSALTLDIWAAQHTGADERRIGTLFEQAQDSSRRGDYGRAEQIYRGILRSDPQILSARVNLGLACYSQHKNVEAIAELGKALSANPHEFSALLFSGLAYLGLGELDRAEHLLQAAARVNDRDPLLFWALGSLATNRGDTNTAVLFLERSVALDPNNPRAIWLLGQAYARLAYRKEERPLVPANYTALVDQCLDWVAREQPNSALLHVFKGDVFAARKLSLEALAEYQKAAEIDSHWPDIRLLIGSLLGVLGRYHEAIDELQTQLQLEPNDARVFSELGVVNCEAGNYSVALPYLKKAIELDSHNYGIHVRLGQVYMNTGQPSLAAVQLEQAIKLNPEKSDGYYWLHRALRALNQPRRAAWALDQFTLLKSEDSH